jgi:hypothetical protein
VNTKADEFLPALSWYRCSAKPAMSTRPPALFSKFNLRKNSAVNFTCCFCNDVASGLIRDTNGNCYHAPNTKRKFPCSVQTWQQ